MSNISSLKKKKKKYKPTNIVIEEEDEKMSHISQSGKFLVQDIKFGKQGLVNQVISPKENSTPDSPSLLQKEKEEDKEIIQWDDIKTLSKLGAGASASVKKIQSKKTQKKYAMKCVIVDKEDIQPKIIESEVKSLYNSGCPYIIELYNVFFREGCIYMIIELMDCGSLDDVLKTTGKIPEGVISKIGYMILKGLDYLHRVKRIVHRDIKPGNILLNRKGICKLADFGMAGHRSATQNADFSTFQGTLTYMSPERIKGEKHSFDSDLWSVGLTLVQCALGVFPYDLDEYTMWEMLKHIESKAIGTKLKGFSDEFKEFIDACMIMDPKKRKTAAELLNFDFIKKNRKTKPSVGRWLHDNYVKKKIETKKKKEEKK